MPGAGSGAAAAARLPRRGLNARRATTPPRDSLSAASTPASDVPLKRASAPGPSSASTPGAASGRKPSRLIVVSTRWPGASATWASPSRRRSPSCSSARPPSVTRRELDERARPLAVAAEDDGLAQRCHGAGAERERHATLDVGARRDDQRRLVEDEPAAGLDDDIELQPRARRARQRERRGDRLDDRASRRRARRSARDRGRRPAARPGSGTNAARTAPSRRGRGSAAPGAARAAARRSRRRGRRRDDGGGSVRVRVTVVMIGDPADARVQVPARGGERVELGGDPGGDGRGPRRRRQRQREHGPARRGAARRR